MSLSGWRRPTATGGVRSRANFAGAVGPHPASGEGKLVLTTAPWSQTTATGIPEGFHSGLPCPPVAIREQRVPGAAGGAEAEDHMPPSRQSFVRELDQPLQFLHRAAPVNHLPGQLIPFL